MTLRCGEQGSALIEAVVALAVVALVLAVVSYGIAGTAARDRAAADTRMATMIAQSRIAAIGAETPLVPGRVGGGQGLYTWSTIITPAAAAPSSSGRLLDIDVAVARAGAETPLVRLHTLRLVPVPAS